MIYLNARTAQGRETVDSVELDAEYWPTPRDVRKEARRLSGADLRNRGLHLNAPLR